MTIQPRLIRPQLFRLVSILGAGAVGFWSPVRILDYQDVFTIDLVTELLVAGVLAINIALYFYESERDARLWRNWFRAGVVLDAFTLLPLAFVVHAVSQMGAVPMAYNLALLSKLLMVRHVWRIKAFLDDLGALGPTAHRMLPIALVMPILVHLTACEWIYLGSGTAGADPDHVNEYIKAIYWAITTLTTVGYGDISAKSPMQMIFSAGVQVVGVGVFGYVLSNVSSLLTRLDMAREHHMDNLDRAETFMKTHHLPQSLRAKVRGYYRYIWANVGFHQV